MKKMIRNLVFAGIVLLILVVFLLWGPPKFYEKTSTSEFCNSCHVMDSQFEAWFLTGLHRNIKCVECHLPNHNSVSHFFWKGFDGIKDFIWFHTNIFSEPIEITSHGEKTIQENCIRCHENMVSGINVEDRNCWDCHRRVNHEVVDFAIKE